MRLNKLSDELRNSVNQSFLNRVPEPCDDVENELRFFAEEDGRLNDVIVVPGSEPNELFDVPDPNGIVYDDIGFPVPNDSVLTREDLLGLNLGAGNPGTPSPVVLEVESFSRFVDECVAFHSSVVVGGSTDNQVCLCLNFILFRC
jgi:hypothetical protein